MKIKTKNLILILSISFISLLNFAYGEKCLVSEIFLKRHSGTFYDPMLYVNDDQINALIQSARWAPSSYNDQPWTFIICDREQTPEAYSKALSSIYGTQQEWVQNAPLLIIVITHTKFRYNDEPNEWAEYDTGAAALSMSLQATDLGLMAHQIGGFDREEICEQFQIPEDYKPMTLIAIGYEIEESENELRERLPIEESFFQGDFGNSFQPSGSCGSFLN